MSNTHYERLGGDAGIRRLVDRFYDLMDSDPDYYGIRKLHPADLSGSRDKLYWFLSGWTGGPQHYTERVGHPMLRRRHFPYAIGDAERDQWMACMQQALRDGGYDAALQAEMLAAFQRTADHMRNQAD